LDPRSRELKVGKEARKLERILYEFDYAGS
jgi:hypothetical protein